MPQRPPRATRPDTLCPNTRRCRSIPSAVASPASAQSRAVQAANDVTLSVGTGQLVSLDGTISDVFVANDAIADVQVRSADQIYIFGKGPGQTKIGRAHV